MILSAAELLALKSGPPNLAIFMRLAMATPLRCWLGIGDIRPGLNALDPDGVLYHGFGQLLNIPAMAQLINGAAERVDISLCGVDDGILALAGFANAVQGKACDIGLGIMGTDWKLLGAVHWCRHYTADVLSMSITPAGDPDGQTIKAATLSIGSLTTGRKRPTHSFFNNQDQQYRSLAVNPTLPLDRFCDRTQIYSIAGWKQWPRY
jgi:hypothetical protein